MEGIQCDSNNNELANVSQTSSSDSIKCFLTTANVGTLFEQLDKLIEPWINEFTKSLNSYQPEFVALHLQEVGGKNYRETMQLIDPFFKKFLSNSSIRQFDRYLILIDSDFTDDSTFTSLCCIYLIHSSLSKNDVELFNFKSKSYQTFTHRLIYTGNLYGNSYIYKERYGKDFFKEGPWSRKGFIQSKWRIRNQPLDLVNIHLFHDPSNLIALTESPSRYSLYRKRALEYSIQKVETNQTSESFFSIFGDFNFRLDLALLVDTYCDKTKQIATKNSTNSKMLRLVCRNSNSEDVYTIEDKKFKWHKNTTIQSEKNLLSQFDQELSLVKTKIFEPGRTFPPSYPFVEDMQHADKYMESRCPAWCDRILLNANLRDLVDKSTSVVYDMMGEDVCMGDHKPIYLFFHLPCDKSTTTATTKQREQPVTNGFEASATTRLDICENANSRINCNNVHNDKEDRDELLKLTHVNDDNTYLTRPINYAFINDQFANLNKPDTDLHDHTYFVNFNKERSIIEFPSFSHYTLSNLDALASTLNATSNEHLSEDIRKLIVQSNCSNEIVRRHVTLDDLFADILAYLTRTETNETQADELRSLVLRVTTLVDANMFKFKHLVDYLKWLMRAMSEMELTKNDESTPLFEKSSASTLARLNKIFTFLIEVVFVNLAQCIQLTRSQELT